MRRTKTVELVTGPEVLRHRIDEVLTALHFLEAHGFAHMVGIAYELCRDPQGETVSRVVALKLRDEGMIERYLDDGHVVMDAATQSIILAAVKRVGLGRYQVVKTAKEIISR
jgi:hypothetical protein